MNVVIHNRRSEPMFFMLWGQNVSASIAPATAIPLPAGDFSFTLDNISSGRFYFSLNTALATDQEPDGANQGLPSYKIRFDKVELSVPGFANLTAVDFFGLAFSLRTASNGQPLDSLGYRVTANDLIGNLSALSGGGAAVRDAGTVVRLLSPVKAPDQYVNATPSVAGYVKTVAQADLAITLKGMFFGSPSRPYSFHGSFEADGSISLSDDVDTIRVEGSTLAAAIYTCNGSYTLNGQPHTPGNDVYAAVYRDLVAGFNFGYINGSVPQNDSSQWWTKPGFDAVNTMYSPWARDLSVSSDAYGFPFTDNGLHVLADLRGADKLEVAILADDEVEHAVTGTLTHTNPLLPHPGGLGRSK